MKKQIALIVLDGWGYREETANNAVADARTPIFDALWAKWPHSLLEASGEAVGLPEGQIGNSEIGHTTIGAGKAIDTDLIRINKAVRNNQLGENEVFNELFDHVAKNNSTLHVLGLLSDGGVHSHKDHMLAVLRVAVEKGINKIAIHVFTDGRDTAPRSAGEHLVELENLISELGTGVIATVSGRYFAMDRDNNWNRTEKVEEALFRGHADQIESHRKPSEVVREVYANGGADEHMEPIVFLDEGDTYTIKENDGVFLVNYRPDRMRQISKKLVERTKDSNIFIASMTEYEPTLPFKIAFPLNAIETTLAAEVSAAGLTQQHVAETDKFPHVTYFLNGRRELPHEGEEHVMLESRKDVKIHSQAPEMRAEGIADEAIKRIEGGVDFTFINFANPDMVGHSGDHDATVVAVEVTDTQLGRVVDVMEKRGGIVFVTADHGNAEITFDTEIGEKHTAHTLSRVPAILVGAEGKLLDGSLADIAPTVLNLFDLPVPKAMQGKNLLQK